MPSTTESSSSSSSKHKHDASRGLASEFSTEQAQSSSYNASAKQNSFPLPSLHSPADGSDTHEVSFCPTDREESVGGPAGSSVVLVPPERRTGRRRPSEVHDRPATQMFPVPQSSFLCRPDHGYTDDVVAPANAPMQSGSPFYHPSSTNSGLQRRRSLLMTRSGPYVPVADTRAVHDGPAKMVTLRRQRTTEQPGSSSGAVFRSDVQTTRLPRHSRDGGGFSGGLVRTGTTILPTAEDPAKRPPALLAVLRGDEHTQIRGNDPVHAYSFFLGESGADSDVGEAEEESSDSDDEAVEREVQASWRAPTLVDGSTVASPWADARGRRSSPMRSSFGSPSTWGKYNKARVSFGSLPGPEEGNEQFKTPMLVSETKEMPDSMTPAQTPALRRKSHVSFSAYGGGAPSTQGGSHSPLATHRLDLDDAESIARAITQSFVAQRSGDGGDAYVRAASAFPSASRLLPPSSASEISGRADPLPGVLHTVDAHEPIKVLETGVDGNVPSDGKDMDRGVDVDEFCERPMVQCERCYSRCDLDDDTLAGSSIWQSLKSETFTKSVFFAARTTLLSVTPCYILVHHKKTADWFVIGALLPIQGALFAKSTLGEQVVTTSVALQMIVVVFPFGVIMNAVNARYHTSAWWCAAISAPFFFSLFGDLMCKRLVMIFSVIILQMERSPIGTQLSFPLRFALDMMIGTGFAFASTLVPYPCLARDVVGEALVGLHKLYGAALGNVMKAFFAPVIVDQRAALQQVPVTKIHVLTRKIESLIMLVSYEPSEFNLNNILRKERLAMLDRVKMHLLQMTAAATQRIDEGPHYKFRMSKDVYDFEQRLRTPAMDLATEMISVISQIGGFISAKDVVNNVKFDELYNKASVLSDLVERDRSRALFLRHTSVENVNSYIRMFSFLGSLLDVATEIEKFEVHMRTFDPTQYPSLWQRAYRFFFYDHWCDFWAELPKRMTLATRRDRRMAKDGIKYSLGFAVAAAFTLNYDHKNIYYFGMAILVRIAQQTASETLHIAMLRMFGLAVGASLTYIAYRKTHNLGEETLLLMTFIFIAMCFSQHPQYSWGAQYVVIVGLAGSSLAPHPITLLTRITDNVFSFITFFLICTMIFPLDPVRMLWNTRTKLFLNINAMLQTFVTLGCAPLTTDAAEASMFLAQAKTLTTQQGQLLRAYDKWMLVCKGEPTIRGGVYPHPAVEELLRHLTQISSLHYAMLDAMGRLHRVRETPANPILRDIMALLRPFLLDMGKIAGRFVQNMIDATEVPLEWSMQDALTVIWKGQLASRSLRRLTGNIQKNFYAAVEDLDIEERRRINAYVPENMIEEALAKGDDPLLLNPENEELIQRMFAMSFHMSAGSVLTRDDITAFHVMTTVVELLWGVYEKTLPSMIEIYEFEKSRFT